MPRPRKYDMNTVKTDIAHLIDHNASSKEILAFLFTRSIVISNRTLKRQVAEWREKDVSFPQGRTKPTPENGFMAQPSMIIRPNKANGVSKQKVKSRVPNDRYRRTTLAQKVQAMTLLTHKYHSKYIEQVTGVRTRTLRRIATNARRRGYDFMKDPRLLDQYFEGKSYEPPLPGSREALKAQASAATKVIVGDITIVQEDGLGGGEDVDLDDDDDDDEDDDDDDDREDDSGSEETEEDMVDEDANIHPHLQQMSVGLPGAGIASPPGHSADATRAFQDVQSHLAGIQEFLVRANNSSS